MFKNIVRLTILSLGLLLGRIIYSAATITFDSATFIQILQDKKAVGQKLSPHEALYIKYVLYQNGSFACYPFDWNELVFKTSQIEKDMLKKGFIFYEQKTPVF